MNTLQQHTNIIIQHLSKNITQKDYSFKELVKFGELSTAQNGTQFYEMETFTVTINPKDCGAAIFMFETMTIKIEAIHKPEEGITFLYLNYDYTHPNWDGHNGYTSKLIVTKQNTVITRQQYLESR